MPGGLQHALEPFLLLISLKPVFVVAEDVGFGRDSEIEVILPFFVFRLSRSVLLLARVDGGKLA